MKRSNLLLAALAATLAAACAAGPDGRKPEFLTDYTKLVAVDPGTARFVDGRAGPYRTIMFDPIVIRVPDDHLDSAQREELRVHTDGALRGVALAAGYEVTDSPGPGVAHVRIAITQVDQSEWWRNLHGGGAPAAPAAAAAPTSSAAPAARATAAFAATPPSDAKSGPADAKAAAGAVPADPKAGKSDPKTVQADAKTGKTDPKAGKAESKSARTAPKAAPPVATGNLTAEGEVLDAQARRQLGAAIRAFGRGEWERMSPQQRLFAAKSAVDRWAADATPRLLAWRDGRAQP